MGTKTVNIEPYWPGMLRWLEEVATHGFKPEHLAHVKPDAVAITGGADTDMYAVFGDAVYKWAAGRWLRAKVYATTGEGRNARPDEVLDIAYCSKVGDRIVVAGVELT